MKFKGLEFKPEAKFLAHTDKRRDDYEQITQDWLTTNPSGYADWFLDAAMFNEYRTRTAEKRAYASVEEMKVYEVKAPLQQYVQILKRHRDIWFSERPNHSAPRSIILPQAIRIIMPPLAVQAANLVKNTSVLALIAGGELMYFSNSFAGATSYYGPVYVVAALLYFAICFPLSRLALYLEHRTRSHRHLATGDATEALAEDTMEVTPGTHDITGRAAADTMAGGVQTMYGTVDIAPARVAPSPRHPLHALAEDALEPGVAPEDPYDRSRSRCTARRRRSAPAWPRRAGRRATRPARTA